MNGAFEFREADSFPRPDRELPVGIPGRSKCGSPGNGTRDKNFACECAFGENSENPRRAVDDALS